MTYKPERQVVLVVDDAPENIDVLAGILSSNYRVKVALNGKKALEIASSDDAPHIILLDIMMPGMDGIDVCKRLKENPDTKGIPVVFVTAKGEMSDETQGFAVGAVDYITKPVNPQLVSARVKTHLALYYQNKHLEEVVAARTSELNSAFNKLKAASIDTILRLSRAADYKDDDTGVHVIRMSNYAAAVATQLGHDKTFIENLLWAAPMHDIGKIGIPDRILLKPGKLDKEEWEFMQRHSEMGSNILMGSDSEIIQLAEVVALTHHEKWDGSGYPRGLKGEDIPISGRITAIADVFDALTTKRPYKEPFSIEKSFAIIKEGKGKHFDPNVVDAFFAAEENILKIKKRYQDGSIIPMSPLAPN
ncbi:MAG: two-component system response regulator [Deltaproteobacteria bacterium]|nr:two-component system response regulator [Deltaproteobacteria bacterium]